MTSLLNRFLDDERGATSIEYALIAGVVSVSIIIGLTSIKTALNTHLNTVAQNISSASR
jgi:pilus assembly protein Flp/PilA